MPALAPIAIEVCPNAAALAAFAAGDGDVSVEAHIDVCSACRAAVSWAVKGRAGQACMGRYELGTVIGAGGMGVVYRAWDPQLGRAVAVKVVAGGAADRERLLREARNLARVTHAHVCGVFDAGVEGDDVWIAMELIDGVTLREWHGARSADEILRALVAAGRGLAAAHAAGVVHRDVKPENVLVARDGRAVVTDFGLARVELGAATTIEMDGRADAEVSRATIAGTPAYMAPEQLTGADVDARADQFAWALSAWELVRGARPFPVEPAARIAAVRAGLSAHDRLGRVLARAMREAPRERFASMDELLAEVERATRRRRGARIAAVAGIVVAGGAIAVGFAMRGGDERVEMPAPVRGPVVAARPAQPAPAPPQPAQAPSPTQAQAPAPQPPSHQPIAPAPAPAKARPSDPLFGPVDPARAEATIAMECGIPIDPAHPEPGLASPVADWGRVVRWTETDVDVAGRTMRKLLYEVKGARRTYVFDGRAFAQTLGSLDAAVGEIVVLCPGDDIDLYAPPAGWPGPVNAVNAYERVARAPLVPAREVKRAAGARGRVLIHAAPRGPIDGGWDMGGWRLEVGAGVKGAELLAIDRDAWIVADVDDGVGKAVEVRARLF